MAAAKEALEVLSREPSAQPMAQYREDAAIERRLYRAADRAEGQAATARAYLRKLCAGFAIPLDDARLAAIGNAARRARSRTVMSRAFTLAALLASAPACSSHDSAQPAPATVAKGTFSGLATDTSRKPLPGVEVSTTPSATPVCV